MNLHKQARLSPRGRALLVQRVVDEGLRVEEVAHAPASASALCTSGCGALGRRPSRLDGPVVAADPLPPCDAAGRSRAVDPAPPGAADVSPDRRALNVAPNTTARLLRRAGLHRLAELMPARLDNRYEHAAPDDRQRSDRSAGKRPNRSAAIQTADNCRLRYSALQLSVQRARALRCPRRP